MNFKLENNKMRKIRGKKTSNQIYFRLSENK